MAKVNEFVYSRIPSEQASCCDTVLDFHILQFFNDTCRKLTRMIETAMFGKSGRTVSLTQTLFGVVFSLLSFGQAFADYQMDVAPDILTFHKISGEAQSTVVPPGKKTECPDGRFLVSIDSKIHDLPATNMPPDQGLVVGRDLGDPSNPVIEATFSVIPHHLGSYQLSNDPDLITLDNGDVLYLGHTRSFVPLTPKPPWFDVTFKFSGGNLYGPGARSIVMVWKSTDCGQSFQYLSEMDPAQYEDGSCAFPQMPPAGISPTDPPGSINRPVFGMGGGDGPLTKLDPRTGRLYMVFQCVGNVPDTSHAYFNLSSTKLKKTLLLVSDNHGANWISLGFIEGISSWRFGFAALSGDWLVLSRGNNLFIGAKTGVGGVYQFGGPHSAPEKAGWAWTKPIEHSEYFTYSKVLACARCKYIHANILTYTLLARTPGSNNLLFIFPSTITDHGKTSFGFRMYFYNVATNTFIERDPIMPEVRNINNLLMHPVIIDNGSGPLLLYWTDINGDTNRGTIRGRVIYGYDHYSPDFPISRVGGLKYSWNIALGYYWYGDYQTAGGYEVEPISTSDWVLTRKRYKYYPMWVQSDNTVRYTEVTLTSEGESLQPTMPAKPGGIKPVQPEITQPGPPPVEILDYEPSAFEQNLMNYGRNKDNASPRPKLEKKMPHIQRLPVTKPDNQEINVEE